MRGIAVTYVLSDDQWARLEALAERCHDAGILDEHHSAHELLGMALRANGADTVNARLDAMERDLAGIEAAT